VIEGFVDNPILFAPVILLLAGAFVVLMRTKNAMDLELDMDDEDEVEFDERSEDESNYDEGVDETRHIEDDSSEENDNEGSHVTAVEPREKSEPKPVKARRKAVQKMVTKDGPITKVKRRRLDSSVITSDDPPQRKTASKKKVVKETPTPKKVKTRRVVTYSGKNDVHDDED
jgi:hypothetical protein